jgi:hypothetical protein
VRSVAVIDLERLDVEVIDATREELLEALDEACRERLGMTAQEFMAILRSGEEPDEPGAVRLAVLASALIERK